MNRPTHIRLMWEHSVDLPLWDRSPDGEPGPLARGALGITAELEQRLSDWNAAIEAYLGDDFEWPSPEASLESSVAEFLLAAELQAELGTGTTVFVGDDEDRDAVTSTGDAHVEAVSSDGRRFTPRRPTVVEQMQAMPESEFRAMTRGVDLDALVWTPGRRPERVLLAPTESGMPLADRTPLVDRPDEPLAAGTLRFDEALVARLRDWNDRWLGDERTVEYLVSGFRLAADLQHAVGPHTSVLFPASSTWRSTPAPETLALVARLRSLT
ncbi:hypothetical protein MN032_01375 [Agromyces atrinae]|uniref:hypothetical protein n=1 Tax=Agromyces atrinae TaxID=592376 RepID=UPI001F5760C7|nr:hypothetical protein [Agromyces atrinae]MCI2956327.1 hypothetical protein [Agromyces atrinae]